jgi:hypothetical protein
MTRRFALLPVLLLTTACAGGHGPALLQTPGERLHAAARAAQAVYDPDSAGGTGYGTTAQLLRRMGPGSYGTPQPWPDDLAFRPGVVYVAVDNEGRLASLWIVERSGRALLADAGAPHHRIAYQTRPPAVVAEGGIMLIRPGVLTGDMIRSALERAGFHGVALSAASGGQLADGVRPLMYGGDKAGLPPDDTVGFTILRTAADARKAAADMKLPPHHISVVIGTASIRYTWTATSPNHSGAFMKAVAELRREVGTK